GMVAALTSRPFERAIVLGVDYPLMNAEMLRDLLRVHDYMVGRSPAVFDAVIPVAAARPQPLCALYLPSSVAPLQQYFESGGRTVMELTHRLRSYQVQVGRNAVAFTNVNTPEDLERAGALAKVAPR